MRRLLLGMAIAATAMLTGVANADDHQIAEFIKSRLQVEQQRGNLRGFNVDMRVDRGTVWFKGHVSSEEQERLILSTAQKAGYLGVVQVVDDIEIQDTGVAQISNPIEEQVEFQAASYQEPANYTPPRPQAPAVTNDVYSSGTPLPFATAGTQQSVPATQASVGISPEAIGPAPNFGGGPAPMSMAPGAMTGNPNMPGYAWPGYAASPNYGAISYPRQYSASAWPYIGPFYPYPQVPLGWRRVELEWDDGWWYLDFHDR